VVLAAGFSASCASFVSSATTWMSHNLSAAVLNQTDPMTVRQGARATSRAASRVPT
jgi:hypothetical protein